MAPISDRKETAMTTMHRSRERGAILIHVATGLVALIAISAMSVDMGVLWAARSQAQSVADAGAMAGATARILADLDDPPLPNGVAYNAAVTTAQQNKIWGDVPTTFQVSWNRPTGVPTFIQGKFARVDVFRNGENGSTKLPTFFLNLVGVSSQGVKATATAVAAVANATNNCLKPWMIPDKWAEVTAPATDYNGADYYTPPDPVTGLGGTGYRVPQDIGTIVTLHPGSPSGAISPSDYYDMDLGNGNGGKVYRENIEGCSGVSASIGGQLTTQPGHDVGNTDKGVDGLVALDPGASWDGTKIVGSCCAISPRVVPISMFSPAEFASLDRTSGKFNLTIVNFLGFFVQSRSGDNITGVLVSTAGELNPNGPQVGPGAAFLQKVVLVR
jgi:Flp pilus assembly protein TadG